MKIKARCLFRRTDLAAIACGFALLTVACESDGATMSMDGDGSPTGDGGTSTGDGGSSSGDDTAYVIGTRVWDDTTTTSYFHVATSLEPGTTLDPRKALEVSGAAKLYAVAGLGWFAVGGGEEPTITRYTIENGRFVAGERISLQNYGVQGLWDTLYVVSPTKMYYPDRDGRQLIVINPTEMTVDGAIQLPATEREGYLALYGYDAIERGDKLLFSIGWFDWTNDQVLGETGLVVLDTATDTVARLDVDGRCGGITTPITLASGDTYFVSSALAAAAHRLGRLGTAPCALRVRAGAESFDPEYARNLEDLTGARMAGEPVPAGRQSLFLRVFDETAGTIEEGNTSWELTGQTVWHWWRWDLATGEANPVESLEPSTADVLWFEVDGRVYGSETTADYASTTLMELTAEGGPRRALTVPGFLHGVARVR